MLTYRRLKALGDLDMASESVDPLSISSQTSMRLFFSAPGLHCCFEDFQAPQDGQAGVLKDGQAGG